MRLFNIERKIDVTDTEGSLRLNPVTPQAFRQAVGATSLADFEPLMDEIRIGLEWRAVINAGGTDQAKAMKQRFMSEL